MVLSPHRVHPVDFQFHRKPRIAWRRSSPEKGIQHVPSVSTNMGLCIGGTNAWLIRDTKMEPRLRACDVWRMRIDLIAKTREAANHRLLRWNQSNNSSTSAEVGT